MGLLTLYSVQLLCLMFIGLFKVIISLVKWNGSVNTVQLLCLMFIGLFKVLKT